MFLHFEIRAALAFNASQRGKNLKNVNSDHASVYFQDGKFLEFAYVEKAYYNTGQE